MKKTTKQATNLPFLTLTGSKLPVFVKNLKFIAFFVFFFASLLIPTIKILASTIFTDNFDSYNLANLHDQGGWNCEYPYQKFNVVSGEAKNGSQFIQQSSPIVSHCSKTGTADATGTISIWTKFPNCGEGGNAFVIIRDTTSSGAMGANFGAEAGQCEIMVSGGSATGYYYEPLNYFDDWTEIRFDWRFSGTTPQIKYYIGNNIALNDWSGAIPPFNAFDKVEIYSTLDESPANFDAIGETSETGVPIFLPSYPLDCAFSTTSTSTLNDFNATGTIKIPNENPYHWFDFSVIAEDFNTAEKHYFSTSTDLDAGDVFNYSIPISLPAGAWKISYLLQGVYFETSFFATHWCEHTGIGTGLPLPVWTEITEAEFLGLEDCSGYPLLERLVCDLKNAVKRIFVPSASSTTALKTTIDGLKNKSPMNYISITKDFFDDVKTGINSEETLTFKILNKTGNVSFAFWDSTTNLAGENQSFKDIFRRFFIFLIILCSLIWAIFYVRKIFK
jgi:hypothetical protein